jgi:hypothetical protein
VPAIESIHTPDVAGGNTLFTAAVDDDMLVGFEHEQLACCERCHGVGDFRRFGERLAGVLEAELFHRWRRELMRAMAAGAGKIFRTDNVGIAMVVRHRVFRPGYTRKHYPRPLRSC